MRTFLMLFLVMALSGCKQTDKNKKLLNSNTAQKQTVASKISKQQSQEKHTGFPDDTVPKISIPTGTIQVPINNHIDTPNKIHIVQAGLSNKDDIDLAIKKLKWKGLFLGKNGAYIKDAEIKIVHARSEMDEEGQTTGWEIKSPYKDYAYFISGIDNLTDGPIKQSYSDLGNLYPGEKREFDFNGKMYTFYATGYKKGNVLSNYKLYLLADIKGRNFNQLLFSTATFGIGFENESDENVTIEFVGDIDGDQIPDLILSETGNFYGYTNFFLSKPAGNTAILKLVAIFGGSD